MSSRSRVEKVRAAIMGSRAGLTMILQLLKINFEIEIKLIFLAFT